MALFNKKGKAVNEADSKPIADTNQSIPATPVTVSNEPDPAAMAVLRKLAAGDLSASASFWSFGLLGATASWVSFVWLERGRVVGSGKLEVSVNGFCSSVSILASVSSTDASAATVSAAEASVVEGPAIEGGIWGLAC